MLTTKNEIVPNNVRKHFKINHTVKNGCRVRKVCRKARRFVIRVPNVYIDCLPIPPGEDGEGVWCTLYGRRHGYFNLERLLITQGKVSNVLPAKRFRVPIS